jgi:aquaporin related protein
MLGGIAAAAAVSATFPGPMPVNVRLGGGTSVSQGLFIEMFATTQLVLTVIMLAAVKHKATYLAPIGIGIALFIGNMCSKLNSPFFTFNEAMVSDCLHSPGIYSLDPTL